MSDDEIEAAAVRLVDRTTTAQQLPREITDERALRAVAVALGTAT